MTQVDLPFTPRTFERRVNFTSARNWTRSSGNNYGHIGMKIIFSLIGPKGAITWIVSPKWYVASTRASWGNKAGQYDEPFQPDAFDLAYHAYEPQFEGQACHNCDLLSGGKCYSGGTALSAKLLIEPFIAGGEEWLWKHLEEVYANRFEGGPTPDTTPQYEPHPDDKN